MNDDMPIFDLDLSNTKRFEASRFPDSPETVSGFLKEALKANDAQVLKRALREASEATCMQ
ncbi:putative transcriptional regulator [Pseudomonas putida]|nr:putative transcriptional regulator [Pseudomonas putida]